MAEPDTQRWQRIFAAFEEVVEAPPGTRDELLDRLCAGDDDLRREIVALVKADETSPRFEAGLDAARRDAAAALTGDRGIAAVRAGDRFGPWRLVRELGVGGMGVVWLAERVDGMFEQRAALKLIRSGLDSEAVHRRFLRERQILARLHHPHIARLIDGGITADGGPYFAMEYVEGLPLLQYCREREVDLDGRIRIFLDICAAVQFAHEHHVVHRDLKPSNVLVTHGIGVKLLDFGIAKLLGDVADGDSITHLQREQPMTPAYAAPEQLRGEEVTPAADVYALGSMLYELLTGTHAHDFKGAIGSRDVLSVIDGEDPRAPSRVDAASAPVPPRQLRGNLDMIVLTALRREPERRYASVSAFAADLQNHLAGKAIAARREQLAHRAAVFVRRHRSAAAAALAVALTVAAVVAVNWLARGFAPERPANAALAIVDFNNLARNADAVWISPALGQMLATELSLGDKLHALPETLVHGAIADLAVPGTGGYPSATLAALRRRLNADYVLSGSYFVSDASNAANLRLDIAVQDARNGRLLAHAAQGGALADLPSLVGKVGEDLRGQLGIAQPDAAARAQAAKAQPQTTDIAKLMGAALRALRTSDPARARDALLDVVAQAPGYAPAYILLAQAWKALGYDAKALAMVQQAVANGADLPTDQRRRIERQLAVLKGEWSRAVELDRAMIAQDPRDVEPRLSLIDDLVGAGRAGEPEAALADLRKLAEAQGDPRVELKAARLANLRGDQIVRTRYAEAALAQAQARGAQSMIASARQDLADARFLTGQIDAAQALMREAVSDYQHLGNPHGEAETRRLLAITLSDPQAQREELSRALEIYQRIGDQSGIAATYSNLGWVLWKHGDRDAAETAHGNVLAIARETGNLKRQAQALATLANLDLDESAGEQAVARLREAMELDERIGQPVEYLVALKSYVWALRQRGELAQARAACERIRDELKHVSDPYVTKNGEFECAVTDLERGDLAAAKEGFGRSRAVAEKIGNSAGLGLVDLQRARIEIAARNWQAAQEYLQGAIGRFRSGELAAYEAIAQSQLAYVEFRRGRADESDRAAARARELCSRVTARQKTLVAEIALARLDGEKGAEASALAALQRLRDEAEKRYWLADALEARLFAVHLLERNADPGAKPARKELESLARGHGFNWLLTRLADSPR